MDFLRNLPFFSIMLAMFSGIISSALPRRTARRLCLMVFTLILCLSAGVLFYTLSIGESFTYRMGHFPAPWGNEIRAGVLEGLLAVSFSLIMLLSLLGGLNHLETDIAHGKENLYFVLLNMMMSSLLVLIYTNDLFTGYVFVEINTIAACGMIMIRQNGHGIVAAIRYMIMSLIGSGLFLIGLSILYAITGHLLMEQARDAVSVLLTNGTYRVPLLMTIALMSGGLAIKSGLYPFHSWIPETYGYATPSASAILSGLVSKGYIVLVMKLFWRVLGMDAISSSRVLNALFVFGIAAMIMGSVHAISQKDTRKMIAYSSVAQIGYIFMGIGLGTTAGFVAAVFHILSHSATKSLLFISAAGLYEVSDGKTDFLSLRGSGYRNRIAGIAFTVGAFSMVGIPMLAGFISKYLFTTACLENSLKMWLTLLALTVSTLLNAVYFLRLVVSLYSEPESSAALGETFITEPVAGHRLPNTVASLLLVGVNLFLGLCSAPVVACITAGLSMYS